MKYLQRVHRT